MIKRIVVTILVCFSGLFSLAVAQNNEPAYKNPHLSIDMRVNDLISRMTLEEKVSQMVFDAAAIPRLEVPQYNWWNECLHGVARAGYATVFPQAIALAATWDTDLMYSVADVISTEARAKHHEFLRQGDRGIYKGLTFWSPNINIFRDPRWGRGQETYGEDPYLTAQMGVQFVRGLQGDDPKYLKVIATPKHYAVHSGPEPERHSFDAVSTKRDMFDTYLPAFEAAVREAGAWSVMCAYNRTNGEACCAHHQLEQEILRDKWGFQGYIVSDCGAIADIYAQHKLVETPEEAAAMAVKAGTDLNCGSVYGQALVDAVHQGLITEAEIDIAVKRLFTARFKLGMFDPPTVVSYAQIPITENDSPEHRQMSLEAARKSIVLLKNDGLLPLKKEIAKVAVIGPGADSYAMLLGNYNGTPSHYVTPLQGIIHKIGAEKVIYTLGCNYADDHPPMEPVPADVLLTESGQGLKAEYFDNAELSGAPIFTRIDQGVHSNWTHDPVPALEPFNFSIRWTGYLTPPVSGDYTLTLIGDDGYRLFIDHQLLFEDWSIHAARAKSATISLIAGKKYAVKIEFFQAMGGAELSFTWNKPGVDYDQEALHAAASADAIIFVGGITAELEGEEMEVPFPGFRGGDRTSLDLPAVQENLLKKLYQTGKPMVLVLTSGSALAVNWANEHVSAILELWYPGQEGGNALADIIFGDYNPAGRLPVTFYQSVEQLPPFEDYAMTGRTYRYFTDMPLYAFGYGLSYTHFEYSQLHAPKKIKGDESLTISALVKNIGDRTGEEVIQLYIHRPESNDDVPIQALQGFRRINLQPGESKKVEFTLTPTNLMLLDGDGNPVMASGTIDISVGGGLPNFVPATSGSIRTSIQINAD